VRVVLDPNVLIAALLSRSGAPAQILLRWFAGEFELVISERLIVELERALAYPKLAKRISADEAEAYVTLLGEKTRLAADPPEPVRRSADPGDDYLLALAEVERAVLVSDDQHLLALAGELPIQDARTFLDMLAEEYGGVR
jgi:uncharacterized protein